ncbi:MAG: asparagine synthase-related protein [Thermodesulfobacteriota bacterium]|nr:asparagine synthase-related protein [Thermodesulfobacteriota bacterium]
MSGICGIFYTDGKSVPQEILDEIMTTLSHRGVDGSGVWREGTVGLGHQMLHTTPESLHETLPFKDSSANLVITADARIDNRNELFEALGIPYADRVGMPDSTLILKAYEKWGEDCPKHLLGDFAFAIWDGRKQQLFCARDHMGFKALYYHHSHRFFVFASEIKGILAVPDVPRQLNEIAVADFLVCNQHDLEITFYEEIVRLPPAHILMLRSERIKTKRYWTPELSEELRLPSNGEYAEALRELMFQAVHCRMRSNFPVGVMLSGGLDSSSVACIAARRLREEGKRLIAVSSALPENYSGIEKDEREFVEEVRSRENNIDVEYVLAEGVTPFDDLEGLFQRIDQPSMNVFYYMFDALYRTSRKHGVRMLLSGFGGDMAASFSGKGYMAQLASIGHWLELAHMVQKRATVEGLSRWALLKSEVLSVLAPSLIRRFYHLIRRRPSNTDWISRSAIHPSFAQHIDIKNRSRMNGHSLVAYTLPDTRVMLCNAVSPTNLTSSIEDMANSHAIFGQEQLHPLLDRRIVEFCLAVPPEQFMQNGWRRSLIRHAMEGILPPKVQWRSSKHPFTPDYHSRMLTVRSEVLQFLSEKYDEDQLLPYVDRTKIERQLNRVQPVKGWNDWEIDSQIIVGLGVMVLRFEHWFHQRTE